MTNYRISNSKRKIQIGKLVCLARTYPEHADEMNAVVPSSPVLFLKPESSVVFHNQSVVIPSLSSCLHHEVELGVVIGKTAKDVSSEDALDVVFGYLVGLDITARDIQAVAKQKGLPWAVAKGFDTFAPISDVVLKKEIPDPNVLDLCLSVNGIVRQSCNTHSMVFSVQDIIRFVSSVMTLKCGDLILTGTPSGVGVIKEGDLLEASLGSFCFLRVDVCRKK